jgi:dethiobiotin synthetase
LKHKAFDPHRNHFLLPAKSITEDELAIKEIILNRIQNGFYDRKTIKSKVIKKLMEDLLKIPPQN